MQNVIKNLKINRMVIIVSETFRNLQIGNDLYYFTVVQFSGKKSIRVILFFSI